MSLFCFFVFPPLSLSLSLCVSVNDAVATKKRKTKKQKKLCILQRSSMEQVCGGVDSTGPTLLLSQSHIWSGPSQLTDQWTAARVQLMLIKLISGSPDLLYTDLHVEMKRTSLNTVFQFQPVNLRGLISGVRSLERASFNPWLQHRLYRTSPVSRTQLKPAFHVRVRSHSTPPSPSNSHAGRAAGGLGWETL